MATQTVFSRGAALGSFAGQGFRAAHSHSRTGNVHPSVSSFRCYTASNSGRLIDGPQNMCAQTAASKYDRIVAFVDAHATPVVAGDISSSTSSSSIEPFQSGEYEQFSWHNSYDEEAEEGELHDEPHLLAFAPAMAVAAATAQRPAVPSEAAAAVAAAVAAAADPVGATSMLVNSWSYGNPQNPKPWCYSWDEEAEGEFELAGCPRLTLAQVKARRREALHEARHAARLTRRMRRAQLHAQLGDLEQMQAWVGPQQQQSASSKQRYQQLLAFVAGDSTNGHYRRPVNWHLTFDEDVHGPEAPDAVLGSC